MKKITHFIRLSEVSVVIILGHHNLQAQINTRNPRPFSWTIFQKVGFTMFTVVF